jgi:hypothetical protein
MHRAEKRGASFFAALNSMLARLNGSNLVAFGFMGRQLPSQELPVLLPFAGIKPLAALGAAIHPSPVRNPVFLITPVIHEKDSPTFERERKP